jgi:hypothetical protein
VLNDAPSLAGHDRADAEGDGIAEVGIIELNVGIAVGKITTEDKLGDRGGEGRADTIEDGIERGADGRGDRIEEAIDSGGEGRADRIEDAIDRIGKVGADKTEDAIGRVGEGGADRIEDTSDTGVAVITLRIVVVAMDKLGDRMGDRIEVKLSAGETVDTTTRVVVATEGKGGNGITAELDGINGAGVLKDGGHTLNVRMTALVIGNVTVAMFVCVRVAEAEVTVLVAAG